MEFEFTFGRGPNEATLLCDGEPMHNVRSIAILADYGEPTRVLVEYANAKVRVRGVGDLVDASSLGDRWRKFRVVGG